MTDFFGTDTADRLVGTAGDDVFDALGNSTDSFDTLVGRDGADSYLLGRGDFNSFVINDKGTDGAIDRVETGNGMFNTTSTGAIREFASFVRWGDTLVIHLPGEKSWWRHAATPDMDVRIVNQFGGTGIETFTAGGVSYNLVLGDIGTALADIMVGGRSGDVLVALEGADFVYGNGGHDRLDLGAGDDFGFGGAGSDTVLGGQGHDIVHGDGGNDRLNGGDDVDWLYGDAGNDRIWGDDGDDLLSGGAGRDVIRGGNGNDQITGGLGNDLMFGNRGGDRYIIDVQPGNAAADEIRDAGSAGSWGEHDIVELRGAAPATTGNLHPSASAFDNLDFARSGDDVIISMTDTGASVTLTRMLDSAHHNWNFIEELQLSGANSYAFQFIDGAVTDITNDRDWGGLFGSELNEIIFATDGDDEIFGGTGVNFVITGAGADTLIYKVGNGQGLGGAGGGVSHDIVEDFDLTLDFLDFSEVTGEVGAGGYFLNYGEDAQGDATIGIAFGDYELADIMIELRGVTLAELQASDVVIV